MIRHKYIPLALIVICLITASCFPLPAAMASNGPRSDYLVADSCYKRLRHSEAKRKLASEWLKCIGLYETIYKKYPDSSWAPAGMYKAAQLYLVLHRLSGKSLYQDRAADLLIRLGNHYPGSAYAGRAKTALKKLPKPKTVHKPAATRVTRNQAVQNPDRHIKSKKRLTRNDDLIAKLIKEKTHPQPSVQSISKAPDPDPVPPVMHDAQPGSDTTVTDLRFWSNPEYTRIVVDAKEERDYFHRLLKKDPDINKPYQRLYIDIEQARLDKGVAEHTPINDNLLKQARAGQYLPHTVRVVIDIKAFENYKVFSLKDPFRIVIDVWGNGSNGSPSTSQEHIAGATQKPSSGIISTENMKSSDIARQLALGVSKIVIDPGHGGPDPGAPGYQKGVWEKTVVLSLAHKLSDILKERLQCTVLMTRSTDKKLTLEERTAIANTKRADLFISLHCNAAKNRKLRGIETYILNLATDNQAIAVAARENATSEKNISDLEYILSDLMKYAKVEESKRLANVVHHSLVNGMKKKYSSIHDLGVKQAPFYVLLGARMPSILIETSFISHPQECKRLLTDKYQTAICNSIADGVEKYIQATNPRKL